LAKEMKEYQQEFGGKGDFKVRQRGKRKRKG